MGALLRLLLFLRFVRFGKSILIFISISLHVLELRLMRLLGLGFLLLLYSGVLPPAGTGEDAEEEELGEVTGHVASLRSSSLLVHRVLDGQEAVTSSASYENLALRLHAGDLAALFLESVIGSLVAPHKIIHLRLQLQQSHRPITIHH